MADRITNLQPPPPHWDQWKINNYREEALLLHTALGSANDYLASRLARNIEDYGKYL